jgi:hypothetical protein
LPHKDCDRIHDFRKGYSLGTSKTCDEKKERYAWDFVKGVEKTGMI